MKKSIAKRVIIAVSVSALAVFTVWLLFTIITVDEQAKAYNGKVHVVDLNACRSDISPLEEKFTTISGITECGWDSGPMHKDNFIESLFSIGPTDYWLNGYMRVDKKCMEILKSEFEWEEAANIDSPVFNKIRAQLTFIQEPRWMECDAFNTSFGYQGEFFVEEASGTIIFDLHTV